MDDLIRRQDAIDALGEEPKAWKDDDLYALGARAEWRKNVLDIEFVPSVERKKGKRTEKHHAYSDEESVIEEWQSCRCSECGRYDTRPYLYYFSEPNYCSWCGADMKGESDATD